MINILEFISLLSILVPFLVVLFKYKRLGIKNWPIFIYIIVGILFEIVNLFVVFYLVQDTIISYNIFTLIEIIMILLTLHQWDLSTLKKIHIGLLIVYTFIWVYCIYTYGIANMSSLINGSEAIVVIIATTIFIFSNYVQETLINTRWQLTIIAGFLFYFLVNSAIYSFTEFILDVKEKENWIYFIVIHFIGNVGLNLILATGLYQCSKRTLLA